VLVINQQTDIITAKRLIQGRNNERDEH